MLKGQKGSMTKRTIHFTSGMIAGIMTVGAVISTVPYNVLADSSDNGWKEENGIKYWYENGVRQGVKYNADGSIDVSYRGKEIYDPESDAWYWLDSVQDGARAVSKDVYQESEAGEWGDKTGDDGKTYGKWVRYDADGHMVKGWQDTDNGRYYFDPIYGTMAKGDAIIDGVSYHFNKDTGILENAAVDDDGNSLIIDGWHNVGGTSYWYENGVRQGVKYNADGSIDKYYRGKEIYDPDSDAWYWLDSVQDGAKAVSKDVYQESSAGEWGDVVGENGQTYGKWVHYDENGHMVKGWNERDGHKYYFEPVTGAMVKGVAFIDGQEYNFDESTGILDAVYSDSNVTFSDNISNNSYSMSRYDYSNDVINAYLVENQDGTVTRVEYVTNTSYDDNWNVVYNNELILENYDKNFNLLSKATLPVELELFGGFYSGSDYNWLVFGQKNEKQTDSTEVYRIVKYTKNWERVGSCSLYGANTYVPFRAGTCRITEYGGNLFVRTCHTMYDGGTGVHHQANVTIEVNKDKLEITDEYSKVMNVDYGYVSHSFDQFIDTTDGVLTAVDLGDAYPRSIILFKYPYGADNDKFTCDYYNKIKYVNMLKIPDAADGGYAYNCTGVSVGGYEVSSTNYLVAYSSVDQNDAANQTTSDAVRNVYIASLSRNGEFTDSEVKTIKITYYSDASAKTPQLVKVSSEKYLLMWEHGDKVEYTYIDNAGNLSDSIYTFTGALSECKPIVADGNVIWYTSENSYLGMETVFYKLRNDGRVFKKIITK